MGGAGTEVGWTGECDGDGGGGRLEAYERLDWQFAGSWRLNFRFRIYRSVRENMGKGCQCSGI